ncbi:MAG: hypothetical protein V4723_06110 [Pseudomonadota bacterium]
MDDMLNLLEWPAMAISLVAAYLLGSINPTKRIVAFVMLIVGNLMWIGWGWGNEAKALIALNVGLMVLNVRGVFKNEEAKEEEPGGKDAVAKP